MISLNRVILTGKVVTPPRRHYRPDGSPVIQFPLELHNSEGIMGQTLHRNGEEQAVNRAGTGQGSRNRIDIVAVGKLAEFNLDLLQRGQHLMVIGKLSQRSWQTPEGKNRIRTEVVATDLRAIEEKNQTQKLTLSSGKPGLQKRGLPPSNGSKKQGE
jgi:single-strand DNA-binding protein